MSSPRERGPGHKGGTGSIPAPRGRARSHPYGAPGCPPGCPQHRPVGSRGEGTSAMPCGRAPGCSAIGPKLFPKFPRRSFSLPRNAAAAGRCPAFWGRERRAALGQGERAERGGCGDPCPHLAGAVVIKSRSPPGNAVSFVGGGLSAGERLGAASLLWVQRAIYMSGPGGSSR